jgi:putative flippase GtrA
MEAILGRVLPADRAALVMQFLRFGVVGGCGFVVDTAVVYATRGWIGNYWAAVPAYVIAATCNWMLNRVWTFRGQGTAPAHRQWTMFLATNLVGFALNRGAYWTLISISVLCSDNPVIAVAVGSLCGMFTNFSLSRRLVFR